MEKISGDGTCNHHSQQSNNITVPLDIVKDKEIISYEGPIAFGSDWKRSSPSLQTSNNLILAHHQHNTKSCFGKSTVSFHRPTGPSTAVLHRKKHPQHESKHFCTNGRPPETSDKGEKCVLQKCPLKLSSSSVKHQSASYTSVTTNISQRSMPHMILLKTNNLSGSWNSNPHNQQTVKITNNLPKDSICPGLLTDAGNFNVILAQAQTIKHCQRNAKDIYQQKGAPQKAIAVVTPLSQHVVADDAFTNKLIKVKEAGLETSSVPNKNDHQPYILHTLQTTTNENGSKSLYDNKAQTKEVPSESVLATGNSQCVKDDGPAENNKLPGQSERLSTDPLNSVNIERKEAVQPCPTDGNSSAKFPSDDSTVMGGNSEGTETRMDARVDVLSTTTVNEWSLQKLRTLVIDLERMQKKQQKDIPCNDLVNEILKMYWNGDSEKICNATKSDLYISIMQEVRFHCGAEDSVILREFSRDGFHILKHGIAPPRMVYTSSWLNRSENLWDIDKEHECLSSSMTVHQKPKIADKDVPMKEMENIQEPTNEKASNKPLIGGEKQSKPVALEHQKNSSVEGDKMIRIEPVVMDAENTCSVKETEGQDGMTVKNVKMNSAQSENPKTSENEVPSLVSSSTQSSGVSDNYIKPGNLLKLPTKDMTPELEKNGVADCSSVNKSTLPPEKVRRLFTEEPGEEVDNMQKGDAQILTDNNGQVTVELFDKDKTHMDTEIKSGDRSNRIKINWELENYCCLARWFQVLGYRNGGLCKCEKNLERSHHDETSGKDVKELNADKPKHPFNKACKLTDDDICVLRDNRQAKNRLGYRSMTGKKSVNSSMEDGSIDEIEIVDVVTNYEDVLKMANTMSVQLMETPLIARTSHEFTTHRKHHRDHKKITMPEIKSGDTLINLRLFGTSQMRQKKSISGIKSLDKVHLPPETINVRIGSGWNEYPNNTKSQTPKQKVWNSWKKSYVPSKMSIKRRSKKQKHAKAPESNNGAADNKQKSRKKISSTRKKKTRKLKLNKNFASFHLNTMWNCANNGSKLKKSSLDLAQDINKKKKNMTSALNFRVLPESFVISDSSSTMEANQSASADSGWCDSPRKKQCLRSTLPNTTGSSTFQEYKKKYEEKKQRIPS